MPLNNVAVFVDLSTVLTVTLFTGVILPPCPFL